MDSNDPVARRPRHEVQPGAACCLVLKDVNTGEVWEAQLADLSRQGLKALVSRQIPHSSSLDIHINLPGGPLRLAAAAAVCWCRSQDDGHWALGVVFAEDLAWETMGELFLNGVLTLEMNHSESPPLPHGAR